MQGVKKGCPFLLYEHLEAELKTGCFVRHVLIQFLCKRLD